MEVLQKSAGEKKEGACCGGVPCCLACFSRASPSCVALVRDDCRLVAVWHLTVDAPATTWHVDAKRDRARILCARDALATWVQLTRGCSVARVGVSREMFTMTGEDCVGAHSTVHMDNHCDRSAKGSSDHRRASVGVGWLSPENSLGCALCSVCCARYPLGHPYTPQCESSDAMKSLFALGCMRMNYSAKHKWTRWEHLFSLVS